MWNKLVICVVTSLSLIGCGQAVSKPKTSSIDQTLNIPEGHVKNPNFVTDTLNAQLSKDRAVSHSGGLPLTVRADIAPIQIRLIKSLEAGVDATIFNHAKVKPHESVKKLGENNSTPTGSKLIDGKYKMYLVASNIIPLKESDFLSCTTGKFYQAYVAASRHITTTKQDEALTVTFALPYGLHVCDRSDSFTYALSAHGKQVKSELGLSFMGWKEK